jgi:carbamoyl-phosphate synthase large subunit
VPLAKIAARCMAGQSLAQGITEKSCPPYFSVKEAVFPFAKFPGVDPILGPEMKSTGEVMGVGEASARPSPRASWAPASKLPRGGKAFVSVRDADKRRGAGRGGAGSGRARLRDGRHARHRSRPESRHRVPPVNKVTEGRPHIVDMIKNGEISLIVNTRRSRPSCPMRRSST